jgi:hypothetical protein
MALAIPRWGRVGRFLNPGPFNQKEHAASVIMASAASVSALSTEALAAQKLVSTFVPCTMLPSQMPTTTILVSQDLISPPYSKTLMPYLLLTLSSCSGMVVTQVRLLVFS